MKLEKMVKNLILGSILARLTEILVPKGFLWVLSLLDVKHCCKVSLYASERKTFKLKKMVKKTHFGPDLGPLGPNLGHNFFFKIWLCQSLGNMVSYHT